MSQSLNRCSRSILLPVLSLVVLLCLTFSSAAQTNITRVEYYLDADPGFGNGTALAHAPGQQLDDLLIQLNPADLSSGVHQLWVRALDENGSWSLSNRWLFFKPYTDGAQAAQLPALSLAEYYIDVDPGYGNATPVPVSGTNAADVLISLDPATLSSGVHTFNFRAKDANGSWSLSNRYLFFKPYSNSSTAAPTPSLMAAEYYIDTDPGFGNGTSVAVAGTDQNNLLISIDPATLSSGVHTFNFRAKDANGSWSLSNRYLFFKPYSNSSTAAPVPALTYLEYFIDTDPGMGNATSVAIGASTDLHDLAIPIQVSALTAGSHKLYLRAKDAYGSWSLVNTLNFSVPPAFDQTLSLSGEVPTNLCTNSSFTVNFTATGTYSPTNVFNIELSDASGAFTSPTVIGSTQSVNASLSCTIPSSVPGGDHYRIRVSSSDPALVSLDNGNDLTLGMTAVLSCPQNITVNADPGQCSAIVNFEAVGEGTISYSQAPGTAFPVGTTQVVVTTANACGTNTCSFSVTVNDTELPVAICKNATVFLDAAGNASVAAAAVNNNSTDNCGVAGISVSPSQFTSANLGQNTVTLTVSDVHGNTSTCQAIVTVEPAPVISASVTTTNTSCGLNNGTATVAIQGGTPPYQFLWNNGLTTPSITGLAPGTYTVTVTDNNNLVTEAQGMVLASAAPATPVITVQGSTTLCIGQSVTLTASSADSWLWSTGATTQSIQVDQGGSYSVTATVQGCTATTSRDITILNNHAPVLTYTGASNFTNSVFSPANGTPGQQYRFEVRYTDADGDLPAATNPQLMLDYNGDGNFLNFRDRVFTMLEKDPADQDVTDGKDYYFVTDALPESPNWKTTIVANDLGGCSSQIGPFNGPMIISAIDLSIFANDITFSNSKPDINSTITVYATIHNNSGHDAENFTVHLKNQFQPNVVFPDVTVPFLSHVPGDNTIKVSWTITTPNEPAWCPMQVYVDYSNVLDEPNELNNQAIRPFTNGHFTLPGDIRITASVNPGVAQIGSLLSVCGNASYRNTAVPLLDPSCAGATVTATIRETKQSFTGYTNSNGDFCFNIQGPSTVDSFNLDVQITDYTLDGDTTGSFRMVLPPPCQGPDLVSSITLSPGTIQSENYLTTIIVQGQSLTGTVTVTNAGNQPSGPSILSLNLPDGDPVPGPFTIPALQPGESVTQPLASMTFPEPGTTYIQSQADYSNAVAECHETNNNFLRSILVLPNKPDIKPDNYDHKGFLCQFQGVSFSIHNLGGIRTGNFTSRLTVMQNGVQVYVQDKQVANIDPLEITSLSFDFIPQGPGNYDVLLKCDLPNQVDEVNENNNAATGHIELVECQPDLTVYGCGSMDVKPTDPQSPGTISVFATLYNQGLATATGPIEMNFNVGGVNYPFSYGGTLVPGASQQVSVNVPAPPHGNNIIKVFADVTNNVIESVENNNSASAALCWDFSLTNSACSSEPYIKPGQFIGRPVTLVTGLLNDGIYEASHARVKFEVSGPGIPGWQDIGSVSTFADNYCTCPLLVTLPGAYSFQQLGHYQVRMTADAPNEYTECNESNNVLVVDINVSEPMPDYLVRSEYIAPSLLNPDLDEPITIDVTYQNSGVDKLDSLELYAQVNNTPLDSVRVKGLFGNASNTVRMNRSWSSSIRGVHLIRAVIDHKNEIAESNELNNEATRAIVVGQAPNLKFENFTTSDAYPQAGSNITMTATIRNAGHAGCYAMYQLYYVDDNKEEVLIRQQGIAIDSMAAITLHTPWQVTDPRTVLKARIINASPVEYDETDNSAETEIGAMVLTTSATDASCPAAQDGTAAVSILGGQPPFMVQWDNGHLGNAIEAGAGNYVVTVTDGEGTVLTDSVTIAAGEPPVVSMSGLAASYHISDAPVTLTGNPAGGTFHGAGITGDQFNPSMAGIGSFSISYVYTVPGGCTDSAVMTTTVLQDVITTSPNIYTIAGTGVEGNDGDGAAATLARMKYPYGITLDKNGNIYIADQGNNVVRKINAAGVITTVAGTGAEGFSGDGGPAINAALAGPVAVATDKWGNLYITDEHNNRVRKVDINGIITTVAGDGSITYNGDNIPAVNASLFDPFALAVDTLGNLFITDQSHNRIRKVDANGIISTIAGTGIQGYTGDNGPATEAQLTIPSGLARDTSGNLYFTDHNTNRVRKISTDGTITTIAGSGLGGFGGDAGPALNAQLSMPVGVAIDTKGVLYIVDRGNQRIRKIDANGIISTYAGTGLAGYNGDGIPAAQAQLNEPSGVSVDGQDNVYICDLQNHRVRRVGEVTGIPIVQAGGLNFDGVNDYVDLGASFNYQTFTIEMWVKPGASQVSYADIIDNNHTDSRSWVLQQNGDNLNEYYLGGSTGISPRFSLTADVWQHVAIVCTPGTKTIYINGIPVVNQTNVPLINYDGQQFLSLGRWGNGGRNWNGSMDELRIWNRALCQSEIQHYMNNELPFSSGNGLVSYYKMNAGYINYNNSGITTLEDEAGMNNGTLLNFELTGATSNWVTGQATGQASLLNVSQWYRDDDGDGFGNNDFLLIACTQPQGYVADNTDCDDSDAATHPGASEICDGKDNDCDGIIDNISSTTVLLTGNVPPARAYPIGFSINHKVYTGGGTNGFGKNDFYEYDPATNIWTRKADIPGGGVALAVSFAINGKGYIATGYKLNSGNSNELWQYDPITDIWVRKADLPAAARERAMGFSLNGKGYVGGGYNPFDGISYADFWEYDPITNSWSRKADLGGGVRHFGVGFSIGHKGYIGMGNSATAASMKDIWAYDPTADSWTRKADLPGQGRGDGMSFSIGTKGYVGLGSTISNGQVAQKDIWEYDPATDHWMPKQDFNGGARASIIGIACNDKAYIGFGNNFTGNGPISDWWKFEPGLVTYFRDADGDGFGNDSDTKEGCQQPVGYVTTAGDCDDNDTGINPGAPEICDGKDNNCNGTVDEGMPCLTMYRTISSGNWNDPAIWETSLDNINWIPATRYPAFADSTITIRNNHHVVNNIDNLQVDEVYIEQGAILQLDRPIVLMNGADYYDLHVNGVLVQGNTIAGNGRMEVNGTHDWTAGSVTVSTQINTQGTLDIHGTNHALQNVLNNDGTINWISGNIFLVDSYINNAGSISFQGINASVQNGGGTTKVTNSSTGKMLNTGGNWQFQVPFVNLGLLKGSGTMGFQASFANNGIIEPGVEIGNLNLNFVSAPFSSSSLLRIQLLNTSGSGVGNDRLTITDNAVLNGTLEVTELSDLPDGTYNIMGFNSKTGDFTSVQLPPYYRLVRSAYALDVVKERAVVDNQPPSVTCPADIQVNVPADACSATVTFAAEATDNVSAVITYFFNYGTAAQEEISSPQVLSPGDYPVTAVATDPSGNTNTCSFVIHVHDVTLPSITCPADMVVNSEPGQCGAIVNYTGLSPQLLGSSSTGTNPGSLFTIDPVSGQATLLGATGLNLGDNRLSAIGQDPVSGQLYGILGASAFGANLVKLSGTGTATLVGEITGYSLNGNTGGADALSFDNNGNLYVGANETSFGGRLLKVNKQTGATLEVHATSGLFTGLAFAPSGQLWACRGGNQQGMIHTINPSTGSILSTLSLINNSGATENVSITDIAFNKDGTLYASIGNTENTLAIINTTTGLLTRIGNFGPAVSKISGLTWYDPGSLVATDNCAADLSLTAGLPSGSLFPVGTTTVTHTVSDLSGNQVSCSFTVTVVDKEAPVITCPADQLVTIPAGETSTPVSFGAVATDNCAATVSYYLGYGSINQQEIASPYNFEAGNYIVTAVAKDDAGNTTACSFVIQVQTAIITWCKPTTGPGAASYGQFITRVTFAGIDNASELSPAPEYYSDYTQIPAAQVSVNGSYPLTIHKSPSVGGSAGMAVWIDWNNNGSFGDPGEQIFSRIWRADEFEATETVNIPADAHIGLLRMRVMSDLYTLLAPSDYCGQDLWGSETEDYLVNVSWCTGEQVYVSTDVVQASTEKLALGSTNNPILAVKVITSGDCPSMNLSALHFTTQGSDHPNVNISGAKLYYTANDTAFSTARLFGEVAAVNGAFTINGNQRLVGDTNYFWLVYDVPDAAHMGEWLDASCESVYIDEIGEVEPSLTNPTGARQIDYCRGTSSYGALAYGIFISNVKFAGIDNTTSVATNYPEYYTSYIDGTKAQVERGAVYPISISRPNTYAASNFGVWIDWNNNGSFGDAGEFVFSAVAPTEQALVTGNITVPNNVSPGPHRMRVKTTVFADLAATDYCGFVNNAETEDYTVIVSPCPANFTVRTDPGTCSAVVYNIDPSPIPGTMVSYTIAGASNASGTGSASGQSFARGTSTVTYTYTGSLPLTCSFTVTVQDKEPPAFTPPANPVVLLQGGCSFMVPNVIGALTGTDNCTPVHFTQVPLAGTQFPGVHNGIYPLVITASDENGNDSSFTIQMIALDKTPPTIITPPVNVTVAVDAGKCTASNVALGNTISFTDNCPGTTVVNNAPLLFPIGTTTVTWTATDAAGNTAIVQQLVTVQNTVPQVSAGGPLVFCQGGSVLLTSSIGGAYQWYKDGVPITGATAQTYAVTSSGSYTVQVTNEGSCSAVSQAVNVTVNPLPVATISYTGSPYCPSGSASVVRTGQTGGSYSAPAGVVINAGNGTINLGQSAPGTYIITYSFTNGTCANTATAPITILSLPAAPSAITGPAAPCVGAAGIAYSVVPVAGLTYTWTVPKGWTITSGQGTATLIAAAGTAGGTITVAATNSCGTGPATSLAVSVTAPPPTPGAITGPASTCPQVSGLTYSITAVTGAVSYAWTVPPGWSMGGNSSGTTVKVNAGATAQSGNITVAAINAAGCRSAVSSRSVTINTTPVAPSAITGNTSVCSASTQSYSVTAVSGNTYTWSVPVGWTIRSGQGTNALSVTVGSSSGTVGVTTTSACGTSPASTLPVTVSTAAPATPGVITGNSSACTNTLNTYSVTAVAGVTYTWTVPKGWTINSGQGTNTIQVISATKAGQAGSVSVRAVNACGTSAARSLAVTTITCATVGVRANLEKDRSTEASSLQIQASPNPSRSDFMVRVESGDKLEPIRIMVLDMQGRTTGIWKDIIPGQVLRIGSFYRPGSYIIQAIQGKQRASIQVLKLAE